MKALVFLIGLLVAALLIHVVVWRLGPPRLHTRALSIISVMVLLVGLALAAIGLLPSLTWVQAMHVSLVYVPICLGYICLYSGIEESSPSVSIVEYTAQAGPDGRLRHDYRRIVNDELMIGSRFLAMVRDGLISEDGGVFSLTPKGEQLARFFSVSSAVFKLPGAG